MYILRYNHKQTKIVRVTAQFQTIARLRRVQTHAYLDISPFDLK